MSEGELEALLNILVRLPEYEYNILVLYTEPDELDIGTKKAPSKEFKLLSECLTPVVFEKETPARLSSWIAKHFASELIIAPPDTVSLLLDRCGYDMYALSNEIDKLVCYLKAQGREKLTTEDVIAVCGERKEIAAFDFANAILDLDTAKAFSVLNEMKKQKEKPEIILGSISRVICDLEIIKYATENGISLSDVSKKLKFHEYKAGLYAKSASRTTLDRLRALTEKCYEADLLIKSSKLDNYVILERLVVETTRR
jgi:DNA polymerase-3 subunit delta